MSVKWFRKTFYVALFFGVGMVSVGSLQAIEGRGPGKMTSGIQIVAEDKANNEWKEISLYNNTYAVIIGIDRYPNLSHGRQLTYAVSDSKAVERTLRSKFVFSEIYTLYNEQATKSNIEDLLLNKLSSISKDDAVFVFFAGHGGQEETDYGTIGYVVPYDGDFKDMRKVISMSTIKDDISKRIKAKHVFFVMDSCYSGILVAKRGGSIKGSRRDIKYLQQIAKESVRQVLTAGSANQEVLDGGPGGHSVFTGRFLEILDSADDFVTATEISSLVKERVFSDANARGHVQTPKYGELFGLGDFIFMPSMTKKLGSIKEQVSGLENELEKIRKDEEKAKQLQDEAAQREAERKRNLYEAKLKAKKLEVERLEKEKLLREKQEQERLKEIAEQKKMEDEEEKRLAFLTIEVGEKRKSYKKSMLLTFDEAIKEMQSLDKQVKEIKNSFIEELKKRILGIAEANSRGFSKVSLEKDEFETEAEYQARIAKFKSASKGSNKAEFEAAVKTIEKAYNEQVAPLIQQMKEISSKKYTFYGHDALKIKLGKYNADKEAFKITIASKNIERPIYPQGRFLFVSGFGWGRGSARGAGIQKRDMIVKYNNIMVKPNVNWDLLKQTVISDNVVMEVESHGEIRQLNLKKGNIGVETYVDDYAEDLKPNQFIVNGELQISRKEARKFKQDFLNGFVTAELQVIPATYRKSLVVSSIVVDESNNKRYDLFKSRFVNMGDSLTYDIENNMIWLFIRNKNLSLWGAKLSALRHSYFGLKGWELPELRHFSPHNS